MKIATQPTLTALAGPKKPSFAPAAEAGGDSFVSMGSDGFSAGKLVTAAGITAVASALGHAAGQVGGVGGAVVGAFTGVVTGAMAITHFGNGKGGEGLVYPVVGAAIGGVAGAVLGAVGGSHGAAIGAAAGVAAAAGIML